jgi:multicomponent Na+:H+ antiporter subunit E
MSLFLYNILIAMFWALLTSKSSIGNLFIGFLLGYVALWVLHPATGVKNSYFQKTIHFIRFTLVFIKELVLSSFRVAMDVLKPHPNMWPGVVGIPLDAKTDLEITMLANVISLTPGTLSLDVSADRKTLFIHAMYVVNPDALRKEIKEGLERPLLELLR